MAIIRLAFLSVLNRRVTAGLTLLALALSVAMLLGVEKVRRDARGAFANTISGTDLIVGARSGAAQLLLYSVFRIGNATANISWESYRDIASLPRVRWTVPISLGDSHRGFRVMGTSHAYFEHYRYARTESLAFATGGPFDDVFDAVLGAQVAERLGYALGDELVVSHGAGDVSFVDHDDKPFRVAGTLAPTGTPVDRTVHVSAEGFTAMHVDWQAGAPIPGSQTTADEARAMDLTPTTITAFLVGLDSKIAIFGLQRRINDYREEPLLAIIPGVALQELWDPDECRGERAARRVLHGRGDRFARDADGHPLKPRGEAAGDGGAPVRRRTAVARVRAVHERSSGARPAGCGDRGDPALRRAADWPADRGARVRPALADRDARPRGLVDHRGSGSGMLCGRRHPRGPRLPAVAR